MKVLSKIERGIAVWNAWRARNQAGPIGRYYAEGGDTLLHRGLTLSGESTVIDAGGFRGDWTAEILVRYGSQSIVFEPVSRFTHDLKERFGHNQRVRVEPRGIGASSGIVQIAVAGEGSSLHRQTGQLELVAIVDVVEVFEDLGNRRVDCMKINIEGAEFSLLKRMLDQRLHLRVSSFLIQFHPIDEASPAAREEIRMALSKTHRCVFSYDWVWERWDSFSAQDSNSKIPPVARIGA